MRIKSVGRSAWQSVGRSVALCLRAEIPPETPRSRPSQTPEAPPLFNPQCSSCGAAAVEQTFLHPPNLSPSAPSSPRAPRKPKPRSLCCFFPETLPLALCIPDTSRFSIPLSVSHAGFGLFSTISLPFSTPLPPMRRCGFFLFARGASGTHGMDGRWLQQ